MAGEMLNKPDPYNTVTQLSEKEKTFLILACTDMTYVEIADKMFLSPKTIEGYRDVLCKKLHLNTRVQLALHAVKIGLVKL
jgi:DNA-binding CsgD family transcriptional regulator